jgi:adenylate kinase family enzyme
MKLLRPHISDKPFTGDRLFDALVECARLPDVRLEVLQNHDDNRWWPIKVKDWRLRMLLAGWSTRISYSMVSSYRTVVDACDQLGYQAVSTLPSSELELLIGSLGLFASRKAYRDSLAELLDSWEGRDLMTLSNDNIIETIAQNVNGAGYKVAQCATLYAKGYHCGVFPVDSGMKDILAPCLGIRLPSGALAHEVMRRHIQKALEESPERYQVLRCQTGYSHLVMPKDSAPTWWAHLVLIYFKRLYCNTGVPERCMGDHDHGVGCYIKQRASLKHSANPRFSNRIVIEGPDRAGKTTIANLLKKRGYYVVHCDYKNSHSDIEKHYECLLNTPINSIAYDRSFISELVYGTVRRGGSRLSANAYQNLLQNLNRNNYRVLYVTDSTDILHNRLRTESKEDDLSLTTLSQIMEKYDHEMALVGKVVPVIRVTPSTMSLKAIMELVANAG